MLYPNRRSIRLKGYDYSSTGAYFITLNTKDFSRHFGNINAGLIHLSQPGIVVDEIWNEIPLRYENTSIDEYIIMPDHFHGIICIDSFCGMDVINHSAGGITGKKNPMLHHSSLSNMIRWFKGRSSYEIRKIPGNEGFSWHKRFYEHIIRNGESLERIRNYIRNNPEKWSLYGRD